MSLSYVEDFWGNLPGWRIYTSMVSPEKDTILLFSEVDAWLYNSNWLVEDRDGQDVVWNVDYRASFASGSAVLGLSFAPTDENGELVSARVTGICPNDSIAIYSEDGMAIRHMWTMTIGFDDSTIRRYAADGTPVPLFGTSNYATAVPGVPVSGITSKGTGGDWCLLSHSVLWRIDGSQSLSLVWIDETDPVIIGADPYSMNSRCVIFSDTQRRAVVGWSDGINHFDIDPEVFNLVGVDSDDYIVARTDGTIWLPLISELLPEAEAVEIEPGVMPFDNPHKQSRIVVQTHSGWQDPAWRWGFVVINEVQTIFLPPGDWRWVLVNWQDKNGLLRYGANTISGQGNYSLYYREDEYFGGDSFDCPFVPKHMTWRGRDRM